MLASLPPAFSLLLIISAVDAAPGASNLPHRFPRSAASSAPNPSPEKFTLIAQICGLAGGYIGAVLIWGVLLLTIGRKMRRKTQNSPKALELELVTARPSGRSLASPVSARSATSWFKKGFRKNDTAQLDSALTSPTSPMVNSPGSFDQKVIEADRDRAQAEMDRLYAAVAEHERKKSISQSPIEGTVGAGDKRLPRLITNSSRVASRDMTTNSNPSSPMKAIYPPGYHNGPPTAPLPRDRMRDQQPPASPRSILSKKSHMSTTSTTSRSRINLKNLRISGPIQKYPGAHDDEEARTPLSPRYYNPGLPPSPPTQTNTPTTPGDLEAYEQLDEVQPLPRPAPQRTASYGSYIQTPNSATIPVPPKSANSSSQELPLRGYAEPLKSPDLRTTVLDRRVDKLSMNTPKTSVPYTPYSPYMPFTPITPVTPHLVTRSERKNLKKKYKKQPANLDEMIQSPKEIFGDAY